MPVECRLSIARAHSSTATSLDTYMGKAYNDCVRNGTERRSRAL